MPSTLSAGTAPVAAGGTRLAHARRIRRHAETHRLDIEGLRGVAVVLVVLFHASLGPFAGGFVGVDVFFVISGFLITGLLLREIETTGTISLPAFYARRARRILPAAALVLVITVIAAILFMPPLLVPGVAGDATAAALFVSNIVFASQATDYFSAGQAPSPILHYWSLGVEEQFYLFWPALLLLVTWSPIARRVRVGLAIAAVSVASFGLALWLTSANPPWAFYSLPTRAWELGLGGLIAVAGVRLAGIPRLVAAAAGWLGLGLIVVAGVFLSDSVPYPGTAALMPAFGAALVVVAGTGRQAPLAARLLGAGPLRFLGRISYSLYLWHWPLVIVPAVAIGAPLPLAQRIGLVALAVALAAVTQRLVEEPIRRGQMVGLRPRWNLAAAAALSAGVVLMATVVGGGVAAGLGPSTPTTESAVAAASNAASLDAILNGLASATPAPRAPRATAVAFPSESARGPGLSPPAAGPTSGPSPVRSGPSPSTVLSTGSAGSGAGRDQAATPSPAPSTSQAPPNASLINLPATSDEPVPADLLPSLGAARRDYPAPYLDHCHTQEDGHPNVGTCLYGNLNSPTTVALFGDSHALAWFPAVEGFAERQGWRLLSLTMSTCSPADIPIWVPSWNRVSWECNDWRTGAIQRLVSARPAIIIVAGTRGFATTDSTGSTVLSGDARMQMWQAGMQKTLAQLLPAAGHVILLADTPLSTVDPPVCLSQHPASVLACATPVPAAINSTWLVAERAVAAAANVGFIDPDRWVCPSSPCPVVLGNLLVYRDAGHLTATFAAALADRLGAAILADTARGQASASP